MRTSTRWKYVHNSELVLYVQFVLWDHCSSWLNNSIIFSLNQIIVVWRDATPTLLLSYTNDTYHIPVIQVMGWSQS